MSWASEHPSKRFTHQWSMYWSLNESSCSHSLWCENALTAQIGDEIYKSGVHNITLEVQELKETLLSYVWIGISAIPIHELMTNIGDSISTWALKSWGWIENYNRIKSFRPINQGDIITMIVDRDTGSLWY